MSVMLMALSTAALARPAPALLEVDNRFEGEVEVLVDGLYEGTVPGTRSLRMDVKPGRREVVVRRPNGGATLLRSTVHLSRDATARLRVVTPRTTVQLRNTGTVPLSIDLGPGDDLWLAPRTTTELRVDAGTLELTASGWDRDGVRRMQVERLWLEPGRTHVHVLDPTPPPPTRLSLRNPTREPLRAWVNGQDVGWLLPGEHRVTSVAPGPAEVRFVDRRSRVVTELRVRAERGERTVVAAASGGGSSSRPSGPLRAYR